MASKEVKICDIHTSRTSVKNKIDSIQVIVQRVNSDESTVDTLHSSEHDMSTQALDRLLGFVHTGTTPPGTPKPKKTKPADA